MKASKWIVALWMLGALACGGGSDGGGSANDDDDVQDGRIPAIPDLNADGSLSLKPPVQGIQLGVQGMRLAPQSEAEWCKAVTLAEDTYVNAIQSQYTSGSHHFVLWKANGEPEEWEEGLVAPCIDSGRFPGFSVGGLMWTPIFTTQLKAETLEFPEGHGIFFPAGTKLVLNSHYINLESDEPLEPELRVNFFTMKPEEMTQEVGHLFWYNPLILIPPHSEAMTAMECTLPPDINIATFTTHTHELGVQFDVFSVKPEQEPVLMHQEFNWEVAETLVFEQPYVTSAGEYFRFECNYRSDRDTPTYQGFTSKDEMCVLWGFYWPKVAMPYERCIAP